LPGQTIFVGDLDATSTRYRAPVLVQVGDVLTMVLDGQVYLGIVTRIHVAENDANVPGVHKRGDRQLGPCDAFPAEVARMHDCKSLAQLGASPELGGKAVPHALNVSRSLLPNELLLSSELIPDVLVLNIVDVGSVLWQEQIHYPLARGQLQKKTRRLPTSVGASSQASGPPIQASDSVSERHHASVPCPFESLAQVRVYFCTGTLDWVKNPCEHRRGHGSSGAAKKPCYEMIIRALKAGPVDSDNQPLKHMLDIKNIPAPQKNSVSEDLHGGSSSTTGVTQLKSRVRPSSSSTQTSLERRPVETKEEKMVRYSYFERVFISQQAGQQNSLLLQGSTVAEQVMIWAKVLDTTQQDDEQRFEMGSCLIPNMSLEVVLYALYSQGVLGECSFGPNQSARQTDCELLPSSVSDGTVKGRGLGTATPFPPVCFNNWKEILSIPVKELERDEYRQALHFPTKQKPFITKKGTKFWIGCGQSDSGQSCRVAGRCMCWVTIESYPFGKDKIPGIRLSATLRHEGLATDVVSYGERPPSDLVHRQSLAGRSGHCTATGVLMPLPPSVPWPALKHALYHWLSVQDSDLVYHYCPIPLSAILNPCPHAGTGFVTIRVGRRGCGVTCIAILRVTSASGGSLTVWGGGRRSSLKRRIECRRPGRGGFETNGR
jgi:hypothetical protein